MGCLHSLVLRCTCSEQPLRQLEKHKARATAISGSRHPTATQPAFWEQRAVAGAGVGHKSSQVWVGRGAGRTKRLREAAGAARESSWNSACSSIVRPGQGIRARPQQGKSFLPVGSRETRRSMRSVGRRQLNTIPPATKDLQLLRCAANIGAYSTSRLPPEQSCIHAGSHLAFHLQDGSVRPALNQGQ